MAKMTRQNIRRIEDTLISEGAFDDMQNAVIKVYTENVERMALPRVKGKPRAHVPEELLPPSEITAILRYVREVRRRRWEEAD